MNLAFLSSHRGSNMQSIIDACKSGKLRANPVLIISNNADSGALERARKEQIPGHHISAKTAGSDSEAEKQILSTLLAHKTDLVILAGYMKRVGSDILSVFEGRVLNIHPCLLPKYGGKGMYGMKVHEAVIAAGDEESGVSIHVVNEEYDKGAILAQEKVAVHKGDTAESLAERVLEVEHSLYVEVLQSIVAGELALPAGSENNHV